MTVGTELKQGRVHAGLSPEQISERTKIQLYRIDALENGTFELLPQGIYLDGIVRAYAQQVGIDPEPMVERVRLERGKLPGDWEIPFAGPIDLHAASAPHDTHVTDISKGDDLLDSFAAESDVAAVSIARPATQTPLAPRAPLAPDLPLSAHVPNVALAPARPARGRAGLALPLLALLAAAGWGAYFYESTRPLELDAAVSAPRPASPNDLAITDTRAAPREGLPTDLPVALGENAMSLDADRRAQSNANASAVPRETSLVPDAATPPVRPAPNAAPGSAPRSPAVEPATSAAASAQPESIGTAGSVPNVSGSWSMATQVESTSYSPFAGLKLGYEMKLEQDGDRVTGVGRKVTENGSGIGPRAQTPVTLSGTIAGDRLTLTFVERGTERATQGKFVLLVDEGGTLRGRFSSNAAQSSGRVEAHRVSAQ